MPLDDRLHDHLASVGLPLLPVDYFYSTEPHEDRRFEVNILTGEETKPQKGHAFN